MIEEPGWIQVFVTLIGMAVIAGVFAGRVKSDVKADKQLLAVRLDMVDKRLDKIDTLLAQLADTKARQDLVDERMLMQGKRLDELSKTVHDSRYNALANRVSRLEGDPA